MSKRTEKTSKIIQTTIQILCTEGAGGLTMRKVAKLSDIRLSNLQYYYKDKDALLEATIEDYFRQNEAVVTENLAILPDNITFSNLLEIILEESLIDGNSSPRCAMFREIWALATKMPSIAELVRSYYQQYNDWLCQQLAPYSTQPAVIVSLLMPYVEGYSLMGNALPVSKKIIINTLIETVLPYSK
ncbi:MULTISPECIES: TetR/AcrR family transcriptional regulator [unclassified Aureispira]|uniref:TetR/AcrR family transcriptional regulator n=1 Tax=unclassified Aureispira TaxID=2649989 RepID=UPI000696472D|nr:MULTISPECIES: TetR/AcrR family transcriptional regulator [unclassified Aureispira]WMX16631.1 TetR/AcrR family transcriptional regulator [Aureispira sp. CCB-E]